MNLLENPQTLALVALGITIAGVGIQLMFQGDYIKTPIKKGRKFCLWYWVFLGFIRYNHIINPRISQLKRLEYNKMG